MSIVVMRKGQPPTKVQPTPVTQEHQLQKYICDNPDALALDDIREDIRLFVLGREFQTRSGPIDALAIDDKGVIYIIETKLYKNPDKRLVVAQVLDYGAGLWNSYADYSEIEPAIDQAVQSRFGMPFREKLMDTFDVDDDQAGSIIDRFEENLVSGRFTYIVLMDHIHDQLKDLISFINANSRFVLLGCELEFYAYEDLDILIPKLFGTETPKPPPDGRKRWDESTFFDDVRRRLEPPAETSIRQLYEYAQRTAGRISWGTGASYGSFNPKYTAISRRSVFTVFSTGWLQFNFVWLNDNESALEFRGILKDKLTEEAGLAFPQDYQGRQVIFAADQWMERTEDIIKALDKARESIQQG
jgi:hypothetical protein